MQIGLLRKHESRVKSVEQRKLRLNFHRWMVISPNSPKRYSFYNYTHPPIIERIEAISVFQQKNQNKNEWIN